ncbi:hypothetical protein PTI98_011450 [Pleurotus ostreatus]|nr:hypothetical protein PTI98_011450 [Pleurotus ostreatus]
MPSRRIVEEDFQIKELQEPPAKSQVRQTLSLGSRSPAEPSRSRSCRVFSTTERSERIAKINDRCEPIQCHNLLYRPPIANGFTLFTPIFGDVVICFLDVSG